MSENTEIVILAGGCSCRLRLPLRDLLYERRAAPGRRGYDRRRRRRRPVARQGRDQDQRRPAPSGKPRPKTRTTSSTTPTARISSVRSRTVRDSPLGRGGAGRGHLAMRSTSPASPALSSIVGGDNVGGVPVQAAVRPLCLIVVCGAACEAASWMSRLGGRGTEHLAAAISSLLSRVRSSPRPRVPGW